MLGLIASDTYITPGTGGRKTVTTPGTAVRIVSSETPCVAVMIQALSTNTGNIAVGSSDVLNTAGSEKGIELTPGQPITLSTRDLYHWFIDADMASDGIRYLLLR